jgi:tripeptide aminopeptidase
VSEAVDLFLELAAIPSPPGEERAVADVVLGYLRELGLEPDEDAFGNVYASLEPSAEGTPLFFCAHLDTVPLTAPVEPVLRDGGWENAGDGILGADNKSALAIFLELARRLTAAAEPPTVGVELLFTVCEEVSLRGSKEFDAGRLRSRFGYVFDHATPIGEIVLASPTHHRIAAEFRGRAAHAGVRPEAGRSAIAAAARAIAPMRLGRLDDQTTANVGTIAGGTSMNVVPEACRIEAEVRSLDEAKAEEVVTELVDHLQDGANAAECDLDLTVELMFKGYRTRPKAEQVLLAERALRACGYEPRQIVTGGASDANSLEAAGFHCTNLADGVERNHQPDERVSVDALEGMLEVAIALVEEAGHGI